MFKGRFCRLRSKARGGQAETQKLPLRNYEAGPSELEQLQASITNSPSVHVHPRHRHHCGPSCPALTPCDHLRHARPQDPPCPARLPVPRPLLAKSLVLVGLGRHLLVPLALHGTVVPPTCLCTICRRPSLHRPTWPLACSSPGLAGLGCSSLSRCIRNKKIQSAPKTHVRWLGREPTLASIDIPLVILSTGKSGLSPCTASGPRP